MPKSTTWLHPNKPMLIKFYDDGFVYNDEGRFLLPSELKRLEAAVKATIEDYNKTGMDRMRVEALNRVTEVCTIKYP